MYPTLYDLVKDLTGWGFAPFKIIQSFGLFVALAFLGAAYTLSMELRRKEKEGKLHPTTQKIMVGVPPKPIDYILSALIGFIVGYKLLDLILNFSVAAQNPQNFILSWHGNLLGGIAAATLSVYFKYKETMAEKRDQPELVSITIAPHEQVGTITIIAAIAGIIGAKIFHNLENLDDFYADPVGSLTSFSGLTFYGGLIVAAVCVLYYAAKNNIPGLHLCDATAPGLMLAYGIGRIGCQVAGDGDWGIPNDAPKPEWLHFLPDWMWAYNYPNNVLHMNLINDYASMGLVSKTGYAWPTPIYETIMCLLLFAFLWAIRKRLKIPGIMFCIYLIVNGIERFCIEKIRINTVYHIFGHKITQAEIISTCCVIAGIAGIFYLRKSAKSASQSFSTSNL